LGLFTDRLHVARICKWKRIRKIRGESSCTNL